MAQRIGVLAVCYGSRDSAVIDALDRSPGYKTTFYVYDKQRNPFNLELAVRSGGEHTVGDITDIDAIAEFAKPYRAKIDFAVVGSEDPIIAGLKERLEEETGILSLCSSSRLAIEKSKSGQRELIAKACPDANPEYRVFRRQDYGEISSGLKYDFLVWYDRMGGKVAIKPDLPGHGAKVVVAGDHFEPEREDNAWGFFKDIYAESDVLVEEALDCEEFSGQYLSDGRILVPCPDTRDFKRRLDGDKGFNTGGMASLKWYGDTLPFQTNEERALAIDYANKIFKELKGGESRNPDFLGMPLYIAYAITGKGLKIFEINSRPGDPEFLTVLPLMKISFAEACMRMREGDLVPFGFDEKVGLLLYKVPPNYGGVEAEFKDTRIELEDAYAKMDWINKRYGENSLLIYPGSAELRENGETHALSSRIVASIGFYDGPILAGSFAEMGLKKVRDAGLEYRKDPLDLGYWAERKRHADELRSRQKGKT